MDIILIVVACLFWLASILMLVLGDRFDPHGRTVPAMLLCGLLALVVGVAAILSDTKSFSLRSADCASSHRSR